MTSSLGLAAQQLEDTGRLGTASALGAHLARFPDLDRGTVWSGSCALEATCDDASGWLLVPLAGALFPAPRHANAKDMHPVKQRESTAAASNGPCQLLFQKLKPD